MDMVILVQQQPSSEENLCPKEQDQASNASTENCNIENCSGEIAHVANGSVVNLAGNNSIVGSSTQCSDVEDDETDVEEGEWVPNLPVSPVFQQHQEIVSTTGNVVLPNVDSSNFGDVRVKNSANVHLGNKTFYKGPVTIKQFVYTNPSLTVDSDVLNTDNGTPISTDKGGLTANNSSILSQNPELDKVKKWLWTWRCAAFVCVLALVLVTAVVITSVYFAHNSTPAPLFPKIPDSSLKDIKVRKVRFIERNEWIAQPPTEPLEKMKLPVPYVIISHTATDFCYTQSECTLRVRLAQTFHIESKGWSDIGYNFLVGGDGLVYVGRSWDYVGAHAFSYNNISIGISFIGTFNSVIPHERQLSAVKMLIEVGVEAGKIAKDYKLIAHRQVSGTVSPGDALYTVIQTWPHWSANP